MNKADRCAWCKSTLIRPRKVVGKMTMLTRNELAPICRLHRDKILNTGWSTALGMIYVETAADPPSPR